MRTKLPADADLVALIKNGPEPEFETETESPLPPVAEHISVEIDYSEPRRGARKSGKNMTAYVAFDPAETVAKLVGRAIVVTAKNFAGNVTISIDGEFVDVKRPAGKATIDGRITKRQASRHTLTVKAPHGSCRFRHAHFDVPGLPIRFN